MLKEIGGKRFVLISLNCSQILGIKWIKSESEFFKHSH